MGEVIRDDAVYSEDDLHGMITEGMKGSFEQFDDKKKGSESLHNRCKDQLEDKMKMKGETLKTANEGKRLKSEATMNKSMQV